MSMALHTIEGYSYGMAEIPRSPVSMKDLADLKSSVGFTEQDEQYLRLAGAVLEGQTRRIVDHWRSGIIASIPHLARHSRSIEGEALPEYLAKSNRRFEQWIVDTCFRPYDQEWLDYQHEIALRHMSPKKNTTDDVQSTPFVPLRDVIGFIAVMNETMRTFLASGDHPSEVVDRMHLAWCRSLQLQLALWAKPYMTADHSPSQW